MPYYGYNGPLRLYCKTLDRQKRDTIVVGTEANGVGSVAPATAVLSAFLRRHAQCLQTAVTPILSVRSRLCTVASLGLALALPACINRDDDTRPDKSPAVNSSLGGAAGCYHDRTDAGQFDSFAPNEWPGPGVVHLTDVADAINVSLDADGSVRQFTYGCDFWSCSSGLWAIDGEDIIVTPRAGESEMGWPGTYRATLVRMSLIAPGSVRAVVTTTTPTPTQIWAFGRVCAECCAELGPSDVYACPGSLEGQCDEQ